MMTEEMSFQVLLEFFLLIMKNVIMKKLKIMKRNNPSVQEIDHYLYIQSIQHESPRFS